MQDTQVWSLDWEDPLEKGMVTHSSILAWRSPWTEKPDSYSPWGCKESDTTEWISMHTRCCMTETDRTLQRSSVQFSSVQSPSRVWPFVTPWTAARQAPLSNANSQSLLKLMSIKSVMPSNHLILCHPLLLPSIFPSIRVFSNESVLHIRWPQYWSFSISISPSNEYSGLISFRMDWLDLLAVQGTLESLQHHSSKSINSLVLSFLYSPTLTSIYDCWKTHSFFTFTIG